MQSTYTHLVKEALDLLPVEVNGSTQGQITIDGSNLKQWRWKDGSLTWTAFSEDLKLSGIRIDGDQLILDSGISGAEFKKVESALLRVREKAACENLDQERFWGKVTAIRPTGFNEADPSESKDALEALYRDEFIVKEKKVFVVDLKSSKGHYMVSAGKNQSSFVDGAAQIASLAVGYNHDSKNVMPLRTEAFDREIDLENWDITQAFKHFMTYESELPYCYFVNSGAEAIESALRICQQKYPERRRVVSFEGSFHGRSLLSLHCTYNPTKRTPFELYPGMVDFAKFPEWKTPSKPVAQPEDWVLGWGDPSQVDSKIETWKQSEDGLLDAEIESLKQIQGFIMNERPMAVLIEPMQCEGGDRYATPRFFRGLRALTRAYDVSLIFDEVQTGFGLGGPFFWHQIFDLKDQNGEPDTPDLVCTAKKSQVGAVLSRFESDIPVETGAASIYRGYLAARTVREYDSQELSNKVTLYLRAMQKLLGEELVGSPRNQGLCFAFDLPSNEQVMALVKARFANGLLFYPAGAQTARFRLMADTTDEELQHIFLGLYGCFEAIADQKLIGGIPPKSDFVSEIKNFQDVKDEVPGIDRELIWEKSTLPKSVKDLQELYPEDWNRWFAALVRNYPQVLRSKASREWSLQELEKVDLETLWKRYEDDSNFTLLDLMWTGARAYGSKIRHLNASEVEGIVDEFVELEATVYEPARRDDPKILLSASKNPNSIILGHFDADGKLQGIAGAGVLGDFDQVAIVKDDPLLKDSNVLYSMGLTVHPDLQGKGIGMRLKAEQYMAALRQGTSLMRSRNRYPDALPMTRLNRQLGAVIQTQNDSDYEGNATALYQSIEYHSEQDLVAPLTNPRNEVLKNKTTLSNFVSSSYVRSMLVLKEALPPELRHVYLASGRAEAVDKMIKLLYHRKKTAKKVLSIRGDYFGTTTASSRSLGGHPGAYFDWPVVDFNRFEEEIEAIQSDEILGLFMEPRCERTGEVRSPDSIRKVMEICRSKDIPVIFDETASMFGNYDSNRIWASDTSLLPDGFVAYTGGQLGLVAVQKDLFLDKPLMMISTWDGDEHSLYQLRDRLLEEL